jgi:hypothetical protein
MRGWVRGSDGIAVRGRGAVSQKQAVLAARRCARPVFYSGPEFFVVSPYAMDAEPPWRRKHGATHSGCILTYKE